MLKPPRPRIANSAFFVLLLAAGPIAATNPLSILWTGPAIMLASMMIAWGAESAQFFMAQGFALVILAWMQTLPEFALEALLAWKQQTHLLIANLTGAIRLLIGLGWPMIYYAAAWSYRRRYGRPMREIRIAPHQSVQVVGVLCCLVYVAVIAVKGSLGPFDALILIGIYAAYLWLLQRLPSEDTEDVEDLGAIPRAIVNAPRGLRIAAIWLLFAAGGAAIFFVIDPFVGSLFAISGALGVSEFIFIQWVAPFLSEFPEGVSAFYWARSIDRASLALMNMVSSNITQWTLLAALLPVVLSISHGTPSAIIFDAQQQVEVRMTLGQSLVGALFLINMQLAWWEAAVLFVLWAVQFAFSVVPPEGSIGYFASHVHSWTTWAYFIWVWIELARMLAGRRKPQAFKEFLKVWKTAVTMPR